MKIGVISDTHMQHADEALIRTAKTVFGEVQMVLHAGDLTRLAVLDAFWDKEVVAVCGNMDRFDVANRLKDREVIEVGGFRIGLTHGWGSGKGLEERVRTRFDRVDVIVYGHSHLPTNHIQEGILMFNPGAYSGSLFFRSGRSVGILELGEGVTGKIIPL
ncbi:MAG: YfcE family phosphodiesterase [Desulfobacterales bacterium CG07_land_8_20_14_0_80_52_14]|nr:MAG: YfcE family phosphodiesterase [Desulfobacterales bacterium CG23_combo_of_CG06-09_8_20_14_all_52_9]PIU49116.1 MAG: YfcE family phosphodiesterase [Desulfobacterales bacterium CG07_land_8_20_14_0_80_52_14]